MQISEIFDSIEVGGIRAGQLCTFIRVFGCNLRCSCCKSMYAVEKKYSDVPVKEMSVNEILSNVNRNYKRVTLTGGEPLLFPESVKLVDRLCEMDYEVNVETNGSCDIVAFRDLIRSNENMFFSVNFKLPSSGEMYSMRLSNFENLKKNDVLRLAIGSEEDLSVAMGVARDVIEKYGKNAPHIFVRNVFDGIKTAAVIGEFMKDPMLCDVRFQV